jgi:hypothetical protein
MGIPDLPPESACNGKIDVLFAIGEGGVTPFLDALDAAYPDFAASMSAAFAEHDLHVMVIDGNGVWGDDVRCPKSQCPPNGGCPDPSYGDPNDFPCWALHEEGALTKCDNTLGAGVIFPAGRDASNKPCGVPEGRRFLSGDDLGFAELFACVARVGATPGDHMVGWAAGEALSVNLQEGCNEGFLRDDALLVVVLIDGIEESPYNPYAWAQRVLEAKGGEQDKVVALAISSDATAVEDPVCEKGDDAFPPHPAYLWQQHFDHGLFGSICAPDLAPFFEEAASLAAELCEPGSPR